MENNFIIKINTCSPDLSKIIAVKEELRKVNKEKLKGHSVFNEEMKYLNSYTEVLPFVHFKNLELFSNFVECIKIALEKNELTFLEVFVNQNEVKKFTINKLI